MGGNEKERIRWPIIFFGCFIAVMLYQPEGLGTLVALGTMVILVVSCFLSGLIRFNRFAFPRESQVLFFFLGISVFVTFIHIGIPSGFYRYVGQIILFLLLENIDLSTKEHKTIKNVFIISTCVYALVALEYCITNQSTRFYHGHIILFGASFDPNFIGIPFITASVFLLDNFLRGKRRTFSGIGLLLIYITIVFTASRGSFLSALVGGILVLFAYLSDKDIRIEYRMLWCVMILIVGIFTVRYFAEAFPTQWGRMSQLNSYDDNGRFLLWGESIQLITRHPIFGNGVSSMYATYSRASHNTYLQVLVESGLTGILLFFIFVRRIFAKAWNYDRILGIALIPLMIQVFFLDALDNRCVWALWCWVAMIPVKEKLNETVK